MSDTQQMPKNVAAFVNKYGTLGSRQQDSAFWKEFRKAANAYADTQAHRICDLERQLADLKKENERLVADMILHEKMAMNFQIERDDSRMQEQLHYDNYVNMKWQRDRIEIMAGEIIAMIRFNVMRGTFRDATIEHIDQLLDAWIWRLHSITAAKGVTHE